MITYKVARIVPFARTSEETKNARVNYASWLSLNFGTQQIYIDECGFNLWTAPKCGRAPVGKTPHIVVSSQQGRNQTLILAISSMSSIIHWSIVNGSANTEIFNTFFSDLQEKVAGLPKTVCILDNCRIHNPAELGHRLSPGHELKFLPPYSPFFNPIENCFNWVKQQVRQCLVSQEVIQKIRDADAGHWGTRIEGRRQILVHVIETVLACVTKELVTSFQSEIVKFIPRVMNREDL